MSHVDVGLVTQCVREILTRSKTEEGETVSLCAEGGMDAKNHSSTKEDVFYQGSPQDQRLVYQDWKLE